MADDTTTIRKKYTHPYDDPLNPDRKEVQPKVSERRMRLWQALADFIHANGGWLVSASHEKYLRVEVTKNSSLPSRLLEFGYDVKAGGSTTRVTSKGFLPVDLITFTLPVK